MAALDEALVADFSTTSSTKVFQAPHWSHLPCHLEYSALQLVHRYIVLNLLMIKIYAPKIA